MPRSGRGPAADGGLPRPGGGARVRRQAGLGRVPPAGDRERPRSRRRLGRRGGQRSGRPRADRAAHRLRRRGRGQPERPRAGRARRVRARDLDVPRTARRLGRPRPARHELPRARRHVRQPRGPPAAPAPGGHPARPGRAGLAGEARRALRRRALARIPSQVFAELSAIAYGGLDYGRVGEHAPLPPRPAELGTVTKPKRGRAASGKGLRLIAYRPLFSGPAVERVPELQFQRPGRRGRALARRRDDARRRPTADRRRQLERHLGRASRARDQGPRQRASRASPASTPVSLGTHVEVAT